MNITLKKFVLVVTFFLFSFSFVSSAIWWDSDWNYRIGLNISASGLERNDWPIEYTINFTNEFLSLNDSKILDDDSIRVVEYDSSGNILYELSSIFEKESESFGKVIFMLNGTTPSNKIRYFYIYFDGIDNSKISSNYPTNLNYNFLINEFSFGNNMLNLIVDTSRIDGTSGLYYAYRIDSNKTIFDTPNTERTIEYIQYTDGVQLMGYNFDGNASLIFNSSVKMIIEQVGDEVLWGTSTLSNEGRIIKRYTIYENNPWIKIEQIFENTGGVLVTRLSNGINALAIDAQRAYGLENLIGPSVDPYSWKSATHTALDLGVGIINLNEIGTVNYYAQGSIPAGKVGVQLLSTIINSGEKISQESLVYFNDKNNHTKISDLQLQFITPVNFVQQSSERFDVDVNFTLDFSIYNLNEIVMIRGDVFLDNKGIVDKVNVTFDMGTVSLLDDISVVLFDDGAHLDGLFNDNIYANSFIIGALETVGEWTATINLFDDTEKLIYSDKNNFTVTDEYNANLIIHNPSGLISRVVNSTFELLNYRNDTYIGNAVVTCGYNGTNVPGIIDLFNGSYLVSFVSRGIIGSYELICSGVKDNNADVSSETFLEEVDTTFLDFTLSTYFRSIPDISQVNGNNFTVDTFVNNNGMGGAYFVNVSIVSLNSYFNINSTFEECSDVLKYENCSKSFVVYTLRGTLPGEYNITFNVMWKNLDGTFNLSSKNLTIVIFANAILDITESSINGSVEHGRISSFGNFTLNSIGNFEVLNLTFDCISGIACSLFNFSYIPNKIINLSEANFSNVEIFIDVPMGFNYGNYSGILGVYSDNFITQNILINVEILINDSWIYSPTSCSSVVLIEDSKNLCQVKINNTGNLNLNFSITPIPYNYIVMNKTLFNLSKQNSMIFYIDYNTSGSVQGLYNSNYFIQSNSLIGNISKNFDAFLDVVFGPTVIVNLPIESVQLGKFNINAVLDDRSGATINFVRANVTLPNLSIETVNLVNIDSNIAGGISTWGFNYTNTFQRGIYSVLVFAEDMGGGIGNDISNLTVYAKLNISLSTGWKDYLLGESGSIYYSSKDGEGIELPTDVNISLYDSQIRLRSFEKYTTNEKGILDIIPTFTIPDDAPVGVYNLSSESYYNDTIVGKGVFEIFSNNFSVHNPLFVNLDTTVIWYPNGIMTFYVLIYSKGIMNEFPSNINLTVFDPAQNIYMNAGLSDMLVIQQTVNSILYYYKYAMPITTPIGNFLATVDVNAGQRGFHDVESFIVSSGGPFDLVLTINNTEVERKKNVKFDILMKNMGEVSQDVFLDFWVSDQAGNNYSVVTGEAIYVPANGNTTISRNLYIFPSQPLEIHTLTVNMDYSVILDPIVTTGTFLVIAETNATKSKPEVLIKGSGGGSGIKNIIDEIFVKDSLVIIDINPNELDIGKGDFAYIMVELKSNLNEELSELNISFIIEDFDNLTEVIGQYNILPRSTIMIPIAVSIPKYFDSGFYTGKLKISSGGYKVEKNYQINIFNSKDELINHRLVRLRGRFEGLRGRFSQAEKNGISVSDLYSKMDDIDMDFNLVTRSIDSRKYLDTLDYLDRIENKIDGILYELDNRRPGFLFSNIVYILIMFIFLILIISIIILRITVIKFKQRIKFNTLRRRYVSNGKVSRRIGIRVNKFLNHKVKSKIDEKQKKARVKRLKIGRKKVARNLKKKQRKKEIINNKILKSRKILNKPTFKERRLLRKKNRLIKMVKKEKKKRLFYQKKKELRILKKANIMPKDKKNTKLKKRVNKKRDKKFKLKKRIKLKNKINVPVAVKMNLKVKQKKINQNLSILDEQYKYGKMSRKAYNAIKKNLQEDLN